MPVAWTMSVLIVLSVIAQVVLCMSYPLLTNAEHFPWLVLCLCVLRLAWAKPAVASGTIPQAIASGAIAGSWVDYVLTNINGFGQWNAFLNCVAFVVPSFFVATDTLKTVLSSKLTETRPYTTETTFPPYLLSSATAVWGIAELFGYFARYGIVIYSKELLVSLTPIACSILSRHVGTKPLRFVWVAAFSILYLMHNGDAIRALKNGLGIHDAEWLTSVLLIAGLCIVAITNRRKISLESESENVSDTNGPF